MNEVKDRIYQFTKTRGIPIRMFEELCGMSNGYVSSMRKGLGNEKRNNVLNSLSENVHYGRLCPSLSFSQCKNR